MPRCELQENERWQDEAETPAMQASMAGCRASPQAPCRGAMGWREPGMVDCRLPRMALYPKQCEDEIRGDRQLCAPPKFPSPSQVE
jgi:hypothetical protein